MTDTEMMWVAAVGLGVLLLLIAVFALTRQRARVRRAELQKRFGPEYDVAVDALGSPSRADQELARRARRVDHFRFKELAAGDRAQFTSSWDRIQLQFVDDPAVAVAGANELINEVMRARGYPAQHYEQRVADLSVEHPRMVQHYRAAHELSHSAQNGAIDTEQLRQAVVHYRMLFAELLQEGNPADSQQRAHV